MTLSPTSNNPSWMLYIILFKNAQLNSDYIWSREHNQKFIIYRSYNNLHFRKAAMCRSLINKNPSKDMDEIENIFDLLYTYFNIRSYVNNSKSILSNEDIMGDKWILYSDYLSEVREERLDRLLNK